MTAVNTSNQTAEILYTAVTNPAAQLSRQSIEVLYAKALSKSYVDSGFVLDSYIKQQSYVDSGFVLNSCIKKQGYIDADFALNSSIYIYQSFVDSRFLLNSCIIQQSYIDADFALNSYLKHQGYIDADFNILVSLRHTSYWSARYAIDSLIANHSFLDLQFAVAAGFITHKSCVEQQFKISVWVKQQGFINAEFDFLAYLKKYSSADSQFALNTFIHRFGEFEGVFSLDAYEVFKTLVANLKTAAHSNYDNFDFNSLSGEYGAKSDGIYQLAGSTDNGVAIDTLLDIGNTDFQDSHLKRITDAYIGCKSDGNVKLTVATENNSNAYTINAANAIIKTVKVNLGKGAKGRYWRLKLENVNGSSFTMDSLEVLAEILNRRS